MSVIVFQTIQGSADRASGIQGQQLGYPETEGGNRLHVCACSVAVFKPLSQPLREEPFTIRNCAILDQKLSQVAS